MTKHTIWVSGNKAPFSQLANETHQDHRVATSSQTHDSTILNYSVDSIFCIHRGFAEIVDSKFLSKGLKDFQFLRL